MKHSTIKEKLLEGFRNVFMIMMWPHTCYFTYVLVLVCVFSVILLYSYTSLVGAFYIHEIRANKGNYKY